MGPQAGHGPREGVVGERCEVWAQRRGETTPSKLGVLEIEDLGGVLSRIVSRRGANGPQGPVTQYILAAAATQLDRRIWEDFPGAEDDERAPRVLSALIGHEPFVEDTLALSVNQMRRRWPTAVDWYHDLLAYVLRPQRHRSNMDEVRGRLSRWLTLPFGAMVHELAEHQIASSQDAELFRLADTIRWLWPEHPAVRAAQRQELAALFADWGPLIVEALSHYGLRLRDAVDAREICWAANAMLSWEAHQRSVDPGLAETGPFPSRPTPSISARVLVLSLAGVVTDEVGRPLGIEALNRRLPRGGGRRRPGAVVGA